jgi:NAD kinase
MRIDQKIVLVTRPTGLARLRKRFNTAQQAKFYIGQAAVHEAARSGAHSASAEVAERAFVDYENEDDTYNNAVAHLKRELQDLLYLQTIGRELLPNFVFGPRDVVVTVGQDGLVANTAKYAIGLPIVAVNPDPQRFDGILLPFNTTQARSAVMRALEARAKTKLVTLAEATLGDGQRLLAFNDFFIGSRTHVSARYRIEYARRAEPQSSSGVLVSTGAGSTGWLSSVFNMTAGIVGLANPKAPPPVPPRFAWDDPRLLFVVREPFKSKTSAAGIVSGVVAPGQSLKLESQMPADGVIFSDGIESDFLNFNSGTIAHVQAAKEKAKLVVP